MFFYEGEMEIRGKEINKDRVHGLGTFSYY